MASEHETIITWTGDDDRATVYSLMPRIWRQCIAAGGEETRLEEGIREGRKVARTFLVPVKAIGIRKARQLTGKSLEAARERGRALAASKMALEAKEQR